MRVLLINCWCIAIIKNDETWHLGGVPGGSDTKESACNEGDPGSVPGSGRYPEEGNDNPLQYYCLENSMDRGGCQPTVHGIAKIPHN